MPLLSGTILQISVERNRQCCNTSLLGGGGGVERLHSSCGCDGATRGIRCAAVAAKPAAQKLAIPPANL